MTKISVTNKVGNKSELSLLSAFKVENNTYVVFDSERFSSMGLPIIYVSKLTDHLEKISDPNEWQSVKNYLKGIISGTNFEYVTIAENLESDEVFYQELSLPNIDSFNAIKNRYNPEKEEQVNPIPVVESAPASVVDVNPAPVAPPTNEVSPTPEVSPAPVAPTVMPEVSPVTPIMPEAPTVSEPIINEPVNEPVNVAPIIPEAPAPVSVVSEINTPVNNEENTNEMFLQDKETFLKACENMFDALVAKYQKKLEELDAREQQIGQKEKEIEEKMNNAKEHLANAEAREQVANIAHDNAQKVMDLNNFMPINPEGNALN